MSNPEQILDRARRIAALAQRGVDGERLNAERMLAEFLAKHGLEVEDLEREEVREYLFDLLPNDMEEKLFTQCLANTLTTKMYNLHNQGGEKVGYAASMTAAQHAEVCMKMAVFLPLFRKEQDIWYLSFLVANELFGLGESAEELTDEEYQRMVRAHAMSEYVERGKVRKGLGGNAERG